MPTPPGAPAAPARPVAYLLPVIDLDAQPASPQPIPGLDIRFCDTSLCEQPAANVSVISPAPETPYIYRFGVPYGFAHGWITLNAPGYVPLDYYLGGPLVTLDTSNVVASLGISMVKQATLDRLLQDIGLSGFDQAKGILALRALNCLRHPTGATSQGTRAAGVRLQIVTDPPPAATPWSLGFNNIATRSLLSDDRGVVGFANVDPGAYAVEGIAPTGGSQGTPYGLNTVRVRAGVITLAEIRDGVDQWGE